MQIIFPGQHPMIGGIIMLFIIIILLLGASLMFFGIRMFLKHSNNKVSKYALTGIGSLMLLFVTYNWVNYNLIHDSFENKFIGVYTNSETGYEFELNSNNSWTSNYEGLPCDKGIWYFVMTEDMNYIKLKGDCNNHLSLQIYKYDESFIEFGTDQNTIKQEPVLKYLKNN
jgi:hypothetical protein